MNIRLSFATLALTTFLVILAAPILAQSTGVIAGIIVDGDTGAPVRNAVVAVPDVGAETTTDLNGLFQLRVAPGTYAVRVKNPGYQEEVVGDVIVTSGEENSLGVVLTPGRSQPLPQVAEAGSPGGVASDAGIARPGMFEEPGAAAYSSDAASAEATGSRVTESITVTASASSATEAAALLERRTAHDISDLVSKQEISQAATSDAAGIMQRVTGITIQNDKYVYVRGLGERYSNTTVNGTTLATTEPEKKVVPFDLFSANLISKIAVSKSYSADNPGEFAGGVVEMETLDYPSGPTIALSLGGTFVDGTTGENVGVYAGGLLSRGGGGIPIPSSIPDDKLVRKGIFGGPGYSADELQSFGRTIANVWEPDLASAGPDGSYSLTLGNSWGPVGMIVSGTYNKGYDSWTENQKIYNLGGNGNLEVENDYDFATDEESVRRGVTGSLAYKISGNHNIRYRGLWSDLASSENRSFFGFNSDAQNNIADSRLRYQKETILTNQVGGDHYFGRTGPGGSLLEWKVSLSNGEREENLREVLYEERRGEFFLADESQSGFLLFNDLDDEILEPSLDWSSFFSGSRMSGSIKVGARYSSRERAFDSRRLRFAPQSGIDVDRSQAPEVLFAEENITPTRFEIREETRSTDSYTGNHEILGGYVLADTMLGRWRVIGGIRVEDSQQEVITFDQFDATAPPIVSANDDVDYLPSLSVVYGLTGDQNVRFAASQTVNRPEFRELAPFEFTDVVGGYPVVGNPDLQRAVVRSLDARWEWFPSSGEVVAASVFFKDFEDPIEQILEPTAQLRRSYANALAATNWGVELELRRNLGSLTQLLTPFSFIGNYTYVDSNVDIDPENAGIVTSLSRPLQGQADHVFNGAFEYLTNFGTTARLLYNYTGEKIADVGALGIPDIIEEPRSTIDLVLVHEFARFGWGQGLGLKFAGRNLTDEQKEYTQGGLTQRLYKPGSEYSLSLSYKFF
jgi:TonB-dependent receptor